MRNSHLSTHWANRLVLFMLAMALIAVGFVIGSATVPTHAISASNQTTTLQVAQTDNVPVLDAERIYSEVYNRVSPSVVSINVVASTSSVSFQGQEGLVEGSGSGFVIDDMGHIVTNNHVVDGATRIEVSFFDGTIARGEVVGVDPDSDIAVVQVDLPAEELVPVQFANSDNLYIGQSTIAIGSPFGQRWTMTTGIVSAVDRTIDGLGQFQIGSVIQTDAAINPGNSGGPLLDLNGNVIGVNSQIISRTRSSSGIAFAVPSNLVQRVAMSIINEGRVNYSYLGIQSRPNDVDLALIETLGLPNNTRGVVVLGVEPGSPAANAGLVNASNPVVVDGIPVPQSVDIITAIDGEPVLGFNSLISYLSSNTEPGQTVNLSVLRDGQQLTLPVTLSARPGR
jgi:2-alkenal reductase